MTPPPAPGVLPPPGYVPAAGPSNATGRPVLRRWLAVGVLVLLALLGAALLAWAIGLTVGVQAALRASLVALVPLLVVLPAFLWLDRQEAEPPSSLVLAFAWGSCIATAASMLLNQLFAELVWSLGLEPDVVAAVVGAPLVEETTKGLGILVVLALRRKEFDGVLDGIVYGGIVAAGFAFGENILYLGRALTEGGPEALVVTFVLRGVLSPFAHPLFTIWTGVGIGVAVVGRTALRFLAPVLGWLFAMCLHALWNASASAGLVGWVGSYLFIEVPVFLSAIAFALWMRYRENRLVARHLADYAAAGLFGRDELVMLADPARRRAARRWAGEAAGRRGSRAMRDFQDDAVELAILRARHVRGRGGPRIVEEERVLVDSLLRARQEFTGTSLPSRSIG
ncbi:PrsW family intramembrane metalloprotease [Mobilicoccus pelagius]|uniref:Uncharacterized protein n=1 Tax=Mobilicoccus pelagius NBRC 104925 TaxID=1089455 RepID=H5UVA5_9MICO|nr:PrsW family intramembrane metalloprotease [Mobilicoccus pelagius]GAB49663.1 hypothetical protein MOPEL_132_00300 [Mobilicoccus pelagius NBRC 104925]